jgi:hypothetical protein
MTHENLKRFSLMLLLANICITLFDGNDCIGGHNYFGAPGGIAKIALWILN